MARLRILLLSMLLGCVPADTPRGPLVLTDDGGHRTVLAAPARRVVSLIPAATEVLFAMGAGPDLVGRTRWCDWPDSVRLVPSVGDGMQPSVEVVAGRRPDLVVAYRSPANRPAAERLRELGIPVLEVATDRLADLSRVTLLLGRATGREAAADSLVAAFTKALDSVSIHRAHPPSVLLLAWSQPPIALGGGSFLSEIVARAGGRNLFDDEARASFPVSLEVVAERDPDQILVVGETDPEWADRPEWQVVAAVRERRFLRVAGSEFSRPSPRVAGAVATLAGLLARR